jgi:hypothetical protein
MDKDKVKVDNTITMLKRKRDTTTDPKMKEEINAKIKALYDNKEITK